MPNTQYKVRNWKDYNKSLQKRGGIIFTFDQEYILKLYHSGKQERGGIKRYSLLMYEYLLTVKILLKLPWRSTTCFVENLLKQAFPKLLIKIPDYAHASREANRLRLKVKQYVPKSLAGMELVFDSTGVNVYTTSGWHQRKHGKNGAYREREQWKKIHLAMDLETMQILSMAYTDSNTNDCEVVSEMSREITGDVKNVRADGAYDTEEFYRIIEKWGAKSMIPPARTSRMQDELKKRPKIKKTYLLQRDEIISMIRKYDTFDEGLKEWKITYGYHRRSLIESSISRLKKTFCFYLQQKTDQGRRNEIITKINILNLMASYGRAQYGT